MIKLIIEFALFLVFVFLVLYVINPGAAYNIISSMYPLPPTSTTTVTIPPTGPATVYVNYTNQETSYTLKNNTSFLVVVGGQNNRDTITTSKPTIIYLFLRGGFNTVVVKNAILVLYDVGNHNVIELQNTTLWSSEVQGQGVQVYNNTNATNNATDSNSSTT